MANPPPPFDVQNFLKNIDKMVEDMNQDYPVLRQTLSMFKTKIIELETQSQQREEKLQTTITKFHAEIVVFHTQLNNLKTVQTDQNAYQLTLDRLSDQIYDGSFFFNFDSTMKKKENKERKKKKKKGESNLFLIIAPFL